MIFGMGGVLLGMGGALLGMDGVLLGMDGVLLGMGGVLLGMGGALLGMGGVLLGMGGVLLGMGGALLGMGGVLLGMGGVLLGMGGVLLVALYIKIMNCAIKSEMAFRSTHIQRWLPPRRIVNVSIPLSVRRNGTMFAIVVLRFKKPRSKTREPVEIVAEVPLTDYIIPKPEVFNLMSANLSQVGVAWVCPSMVLMFMYSQCAQMAEESRPHTHWQPNLNVQLVTELITFDRQQFPTDVAHLFQ